MRKKKSITGFEWRNDVSINASVSNDGIVKHRYKCQVCRKTIEDTETVLYAFYGRKTQAYKHKYIHRECEPACAIPPISSHAACRICGKKGNLDGRIHMGHQAYLYYHRSELDQVPVVVKDVQKIKDDTHRRMMGRLKRGKIKYEIPIPCTELLLYDPHTLDESVSITIRPWDGKIVKVEYCYQIPLFWYSKWESEERIRELVAMNNGGTSSRADWMISKEIEDALVQVSKVYEGIF